MNTTIKKAIQSIKISSDKAQECEQELKALLSKHRQTLKKSRRAIQNVENAIKNMQALQKSYLREAIQIDDFGKTYLNDH